MTADLEKLVERLLEASRHARAAGFEATSSGFAADLQRSKVASQLFDQSAARISELEAQVKTMREALAQGTIASVVGGDLVETIELRPAPPPRSDGCDFLVIPLTDEIRAARALASGEKP